MKPTVTPAMCGTVRPKPKFTPEAASMTLFGPGVNAIANAKVTSARKMLSGHFRLGLAGGN